MFITAVDVVQDADDHHQLVNMLEQSEEMTGEKADITLTMTSRFQSKLKWKMNFKQSIVFSLDPSRFNVTLQELPALD
jgi:hypothetical protein